MDKRKKSTRSLSSVMGDAVTATILLRNWEKYGLSDRVCYHFDLTEAPDLFSRESRDSKDDADSTCGVLGLLECVQFKPWNRLTRFQKRALRNEIRDFNLTAHNAHQKKRVFCHEPPALPLRLNPASRVFFAYEVTRIAFCLDASPTLTATFGGRPEDEACCPLDRLAGMARTFFRALVEPIAETSIPNKGSWCPQIAVSVVAVYPRGTGSPQTSLLVRDFRLHNSESAELLANKIEKWALGEVETEISCRLNGRRSMDPNTLFSGYDAWAISLHSSSLKDIMDVGNATLSNLSSQARPVIVVATDGRSVSCDSVMDILSEADRADIPLVTLDLSSPLSHSTNMDPRAGGEGSSTTANNSGYTESTFMDFLDYDPSGPATFPLHLSDDTEAILGICKATGGCFYDAHLLTDAARTIAGHVDPDSPLAADHYFSFKRRSLKPNGVQWYTMFSLSPLSPILNSSWGKLAPPRYLRRRMPTSSSSNDPPGRNSLLEKARVHHGSGRFEYHTSARQSPTVDFRRNEIAAQRKPLSRLRFLTYVVDNIRIKGILLTRVKEGYRAKEYGQSTQDPDKVFIQFSLPLELGTVLHYELSYKALANESHMVGCANVKIELSGETGFIQSVKNDFLRQSHGARPVTMAQQISAKLCKVLRWIRTEDVLQSYLCPLKWSNQLSGPETPFIRRLRTLTPLQRRRHFRFDRFEVICTGSMPYVRSDDDFLSQFVDSDGGEQELIDAIAEWSTQTIKEGKLYVKKTESSDSDLAAYCVVELARLYVASRVFTISVESFGVSGASDRLDILASLKRTLFGLKNVDLLAKQMGQHVVRVRDHLPDQILFFKRHLLENHYHHESWDLVKDPEVLPLLLKRRTEIGNFKLLESSDDHALLAKVVPGRQNSNEATTTNNDASPGIFVQYQIAILASQIVIDIHMESESGEFFPFRSIEGQAHEEIPRFHKLVRTLKRRDQECGRALKCRTSLIQCFEPEKMPPIQVEESPLSCVHRLLSYSSRVSRKLRFFCSGAGAANDILQNLTEEMLLSESLGVLVARLPIDAKEEIRDVSKGTWFIIRFDRHTISMIHLSLLDRNESDADCKYFLTFRELTFFTIGISDLYSARDDVADDDSADGHISEYMCVSEFADLVDILHKENYAAAAYLALKPGSQLKVENFYPADFAEVLSVCTFVEVAQVLVAGTPALYGDIAQMSNDEKSKLQQLVETVLRHVEGDSNCLYYCGVDRENMEYQIEGDDSLSTVEDPAGIPLELTEEEDHHEQFSTSLESFEGVIEQVSHAGEEVADKQTDLSLSGGEVFNNIETDPLAFPLLFDSVYKMLVSPPLFVRFTLDGEVASMSDLAVFPRSSRLAAHLSVFKRNFIMPGHHSQLPRSHEPVALALSDILNAYVAEQTMERLRHFGESLTESDLRLVKTCLRRAQDVIKSKIEVFFYVAKTDSMVPASAPAGGEAQIEEGFALLLEELQNNGSVALKHFPSDIFVVVDSDESDAVLDFWCLVNIKKRRGIISVEVHHPAGAESANEVMSEMHNIIMLCYHRVNQLLLLRGLHRNRIASELLIPTETQQSDDHELGAVSDSRHIFKPGLFNCRIVFRTSFDLFHRCAANPNQVARKLEETVLDSFAVSNRRGIFVYKDETGSIFYMTIEAIGGGVEPDGKVKLLVYGIQQPGPSVTKQLSQLLQKRLLLIAVDMLSSVLTKNPHFHWKRADLNFIRNFENEWKSVGLDQDGATDEKERLYELPIDFDDTVIFTLILRQNMCGSTFFHRLHRLHEVMNEGDTRVSVSPPSGNAFSSIGSTEVDFQAEDFTFYYNNAPTKLDPDFQGVSTLTETGAEYSREAGSGIAIIEVSLAHPDGSLLKTLRFGNPLGESCSTHVPLESMQLHRKVEQSDMKLGERTFVRIRITDTALNSEILHKWVHLCLNQTLSAWKVERHIEKMQRRLFLVSQVDQVGPKPFSKCIKADNKAIIDSLCPGLPDLTNMFDNMHSLPHPALKKVEATGTIRSSSIATVAIELLEKIIMNTIFSENRKLSPVENPATDLCVIRLSRSEQPRIVKLEWDTNKREAVVKDSFDSEIICDSPIDCPEYICFYSYPQYGEKHRSSKKLLPMLFKEIMAADGSTGESSTFSYLELLKGKTPSLFFRSFAFIFSVKRNRRSLLAYNWIPLQFKTIATRLAEKDRSFVTFADKAANVLQCRTLKILAPPTMGINKKTATETNVLGVDSHERRPSLDGKKTTDSSKSTTADPGSSTRRKLINRPAVIRRPKLIGKSVEGAARQAVAASRSRARTIMTGSSQPMRSQRDVGTTRSSTNTKKRDSARTSAVTPSKPLSTPGDEALARARNTFDSMMKSKPDLMRSLSKLQDESIRNLTAFWWPTEAQQKIPPSVVDFILSKSSLTWINTCELLPFPSHLVTSVPLSFARTIAMWTPGLELLPLASLGSSASSKPNSVLLMGEIKNIRNCKCFAVVRISRSTINANDRCRELLTSEGWVLTLPRRPKNDQKGIRRKKRLLNSFLSEKDSAGMDKLTMDLNAALVLDSLQFDFVGSVTERVMKSVDKSLEYKEVMPLIRSMMKSYPLRRQKLMRRLNYRAFEATVILSSYGNRLIDLFDAQILFLWLFSNSSTRELIQCGDGLCFKQEIIVRGTHLEAAGLAYEELLFAAASLRRYALWKKVSMIGVGGLGRPSQEETIELLSLANTTPLLRGVDNLDAPQVEQVLESGMDWNKICTAMKQDVSFSPSWSLSNGDGSLLYLFFLKVEDIFLLIRASKDGCRLQLDLVEKDEGIVGQKTRNMVIQKLTNYLLHYIWYTI